MYLKSELKISTNILKKKKTTKTIEETREYLTKELDKINNIIEDFWNELNYDSLESWERKKIHLEEVLRYITSEEDNGGEFKEIQECHDSSKGIEELIVRVWDDKGNWKDVENG